MLDLKNMRIAFVGSGKVATALAHIFHQSGIRISGISSRNESTGLALAKELNSEFYRNPQDLLADVIFVATNDDSVRALRNIFPTTQFVVYTAGAVSLNDFPKDHWGVFYPLQSFSLSRSLSSSEIPILLEAPAEILQEILVDLCQLVGLNHALCDSKTRADYHLAAVFVNNFVNHILYKGQSQLTEKGLDGNLLNALIKETVSKLETISAFDAQTGPARRNDKETMDAHRSLLNEEDRKLYDVLTDSILKTYSKHD